MKKAAGQIMERKTSDWHFYACSWQFLGIYLK
jgi:hypothetical protein